MTETSQDRNSIVVRFAGDSGDGVQLLGSQFVASTATAGNDFATFPDYPAEIRAPAGTTFGVSAFQINLGSRRITTAGDAPDVLVAFNPAALKVNLPLLSDGALILLNTDSFNAKNLGRAGFEQDPRGGELLSAYRVFEMDMGKLTLEAVKPFGLPKSDASRCKNFWSLGVLLWMFDRDVEPIEEWIGQKFAGNEVLRDSNLAALKAGHAYGETAELSSTPPQLGVAPATFPAGEYRNVTGTEALALGLAAGGELADRPVLFCSYPITPASPLLHRLSRLAELGVAVFQAEDEIAAACAAIGASYGGAIGVTSSSGPGIALKTEAIGLAISAEIPLVVVNSQRGGPSTGLPTKTEQSDLYQAVYGRNADAPLPVLAARSPGDCFEVAIEAVRIAVRHMTPVMLLTDGYLANAAEPWALPDMESFEPIDSESAARHEDLFKRDPETLARPWVSPGAPGLMHRIGGLETDIVTGDISYDSDNHQRMTQMRADKVNAVARFIPAQVPEHGDSRGKVAVVGWGSSYGALNRAVKTLADPEVAHVHLRYLNPFPPNLGDLLGGFEHILVPEMNMGQLSTLLRDRLELHPVSLPKVTGQPFKVAEIMEAVSKYLPSRAPRSAAPLLQETRP